MTLSRSILLIYVVILAFLTFNPWILPGSSMLVGIVLDKLEHAIAYSGMSFLIMLAYGITKSSRMSSLIAFLFCSSIGLLFEFIQLWFTTNRQFSINDAIANVLGALLGVAVFWGYSCVVLKRDLK